MSSPRTMFDAAVAAADLLQRVDAFLPARPPGRVVVVGADKASARMAQAVEQAWDGPLSGHHLSGLAALYGLPTPEFPAIKSYQRSPTSRV